MTTYVALNVVCAFQITQFLQRKRKLYAMNDIWQNVVVEQWYFWLKMVCETRQQQQQWQEPKLLHHDFEYDFFFIFVSSFTVSDYHAESCRSL